MDETYVVPRTRRLFIGRLPPFIRQSQIEYAFMEFGKIVFCEVRNKLSGKPHAFVEYFEQEDADRAFKKMNKQEICGYRIAIEYSRQRASDGGRPEDFGRGRNYDGISIHFGNRDVRVRDRRSSKQKDVSKFRTTGFRLYVSGLPWNARWQDLKDHMRDAGEISLTDVDHRGFGVADFVRESQMNYALTKLNGSLFKFYGVAGKSGDPCPLTLSKTRPEGCLLHASSESDTQNSDNKTKSRSRRRSPSRSRSRSHSRSKRRIRKKSHDGHHHHHHSSSSHRRHRRRSGSNNDSKKATTNGSKRPRSKSRS